MDGSSTHLKKTYTEAPILKCINVKGHFNLPADALAHGLCEVLLHNKVLVAYYPATLTSSQIERELLAMVLVCEYFHHYA